MSVRVSRRAVVAAALLLAVPSGAPLIGSPLLPRELRGLWPGRETAVSRGGRSTVVGLAASRPLLDELARRADRAGLRVSAVLGGPVRPLIVVPESARDAARLAGAARLDGLAAVADGRRVIVVPEAFATLSPLGRDVVLAHELTHVVAGTAGLPAWLYEGFADYVGYRDTGLPVATAAAELAAEARAGRLPDALPGPEAFAADGRDQDRLARVYQEAWLACRFLADRFGEGTLVRLYREAQVAGVDRALASLGLSAVTLTARWRAYVREQLV
ncbi:hypothetical protein FAF44_43125 [Nonomuraea sp. MG754425]|uniref:hypothetical protein n=1 Tax=Nonomuraea sp. MG754425 TaxID=2570319 RepID=UPI001F46E046|nr:hypothetical protein [Nonomuraea sp. MG754425]MCF6475117.1 hypothetical protein [Nonomuraea sp. MG754425]